MQAEQKETHRENKRLDCKARVLLHQCVSANVFQKISQAATSKQAWDILQQVYGNTRRTKKVRLQSLRRQYELLSMTEQETIADYFNRIQVVTNSMRAYDEAMTDSKIMEKVLKTLTPSFDHIVVAIEESKDQMTVEELQNSLKAHEQRVLKRKSNDKVVVVGTKEEEEDIEEEKVVIEMQKHMVQLPKIIILEAIEMSSVIISVLEEATFSKVKAVRGSLTKERSNITIVINLGTLPMNAGRLATTMPIAKTRRMIRHT
ncbi:hypothetical protein CR513_18238, partial [Mucuna pruriens]